MIPWSQYRWFCCVGHILYIFQNVSLPMLVMNILRLGVSVRVSYIDSLGLWSLSFPFSFLLWVQFLSLFYSIRAKSIIRIVIVIIINISIIIATNLVIVEKKKRKESQSFLNHLSLFYFLLMFHSESINQWTISIIGSDYDCVGDSNREILPFDPWNHVLPTSLHRSMLVNFEHWTLNLIIMRLIYYNWILKLISLIQFYL